MTTDPRWTDETLELTARAIQLRPAPGRRRSAERVLSALADQGLLVTPEVVEAPAREINWPLIESLKERDHPLANIKAEAQDLPTGVGEVMQQARISHHLLDLAGVSRGRRERVYERDLDARVWLLVDDIARLRERIDRTLGWHTRETGGGGTVGDFCNECGAKWPCDTRRLLEGTYVDD